MLARRVFISGLIIMGAFALAHLGGFLHAAYKARHDPELADLTRAMREQRENLLGFQPSILDFREYFSLNFSILLALSAAIGFALLRVPDQAAVIGTLSPLYVGGMLLLFGTSLYFSVLQGVVTCGLLTVLFGLAWWFV